ncbi:MAG: PEP-CTERM sorting domain-containing protein [bacterium]|nr:PEP-CTERM sorting domain-containing protein [bacterium]
MLRKFQVVVCFAFCCLASNAAKCEVIVVDQIGSFAPETAGSGLTGNYSHYDTSGFGVTNWGNPIVGQVFDNFTLSQDWTITSLGWVGQYEGLFSDGDPINGDSLTPPPLNPAFRVSFYSDQAGEPGALLQSFNIASANEMSIPGLEAGFYYEYSSPISGFDVTAGTPYWVSVMAEFSFEENGWFLAHSALGDTGVDASFQDYYADGNGGTRFADDRSYAIRLNAVPEPGALPLIAGLLGMVYTRRRQSR